MPLSKNIQNLENIARRLRIHSLQATTTAGSGHPTSCLSAADIVSALFFHAMRYEVNQPKDPRADRFVLSKGHAAPLLWAVWAEAGFLNPKELLNLRKINSDLEGHPTPRMPWVDVATGSLGQGLSVGVGQALSGKFDKTDMRVYVLLGDGECAEGSVWEAAALASHYQLNNLMAIVDMNRMGQSQETLYRHETREFQRKFEAFGWDTKVINGHDMESIVSALDEAKEEKSRPVVIIAKTEKGKGVSFLEGKPGWHGKPLSPQELEKALKELGEVSSVSISTRAPTGPLPPPPKTGTLEGPAPLGPQYTVGQKVATRASYGEGLRKLGAVDSRIFALDGDTKNSTYSEKFLKDHPERFIECFIAEQNMAGMAAGLAARGKIPFASTFAAFLSRAYDQIRMTGISQLPVKWVGSHAGVSIGEDGPSQMALEDLAMMRAVPQMAVLYPSDAVAAERLVFEASRYPGLVYIRTSRPATPVLYDKDTLFPIGGSKVLKRSDRDFAAVVTAGVTLIEALAAYDLLQAEGIAIRVMDLYSIKPVDEKMLIEAASQTRAVITLEDHYPEGGLGDAVLSVLSPRGFKVHKLAVSHLPRSGTPAELLAYCGIDRNALVKKVRSLREEL